MKTIFHVKVRDFSINDLKNFGKRYIKRFSEVYGHCNFADNNDFNVLIKIIQNRIY